MKNQEQDLYSGQQKPAFSFLEFFFAPCIETGEGFVKDDDVTGGLDESCNQESKRGFPEPFAPERGEHVPSARRTVTSTSTAFVRTVSEDVQSGSLSGPSISSMIRLNWALYSFRNR